VLGFLQFVLVDLQRPDRPVRELLRRRLRGPLRVLHVGFVVRDVGLRGAGPELDPLLVRDDARQRVADPRQAAAVQAEGDGEAPSPHGLLADEVVELGEFLGRQDRFHAPREQQVQRVFDLGAVLLFAARRLGDGRRRLRV